MLVNDVLFLISYTFCSYDGVVFFTISQSLKHYSSLIKLNLGCVHFLCTFVLVVKGSLKWLIAPQQKTSAE